MAKRLAAGHAATLYMCLHLHSAIFDLCLNETDYYIHTKKSYV